MSERSRRNIGKRLFFIVMFTLSVSFAFAQGEDDRDYILIGCMAFGPFILVSAYSKQIKLDKVVGWFMVMMFLMGVIFNFNSIKWSSLFFSYMFLIYFLVGVHSAILGDIEARDVMNLSKKIIYSYAIVLVIQQFCVLVGLPIFNGSALTPDEPWKLNSLSAEPSHTSRLIGILMYSVIYCQNIIARKELSFKQSIKRDSKVWISFLWVTLTTVSGTAILILLVIMLMFYRNRYLPIIGFIFFLFLTVGVISDMTALKRSSGFLAAVFTGNPEQMIQADHSASVRVVPWILCLEHINVLSFRTWVGEGMGSVANWMSIYMPGVPSDFSGGGTAKMIVEQGLIIGAFYLLFTFRICYSRKFKISSIGLWILCVLMMNINLQLAWLCIFMLYIVKKVDEKEKSIISPKKSSYDQLKGIGALSC